jgi:hypothetical protein
VRLDSDFNDWYDHAFDGRWRVDKPILHRRAGAGPHREVDHDRLAGAGFLLPTRGPAHVLAKLPDGWRPEHVVAYDDPTSHCGEGKRVAKLMDVARETPDTYVAEFFLTGEPVTSYRLLGVGARLFWLRYCSKDTWRANVGDVVIHDAGVPPHDLVSRFGKLRPKPEHPLLAVDFVLHAGTHFAVDLNTAPGLRHTPVQDRMHPNDVHAAIESWASDP